VSASTVDRIRNHATKLGLTHLTDVITQLVQRAEAEQMGYLDLVDLLLEEELGLREGRRFRNALKLSRLPHYKTLDEFDLAFQPDLDARKVRDLATLEFVPVKSNIALLGPPGVGKNHARRRRLPSRVLHLLHHPSTTWSAGSASPPAKPGSPSTSPPLDDLVRRLRVAEATGRFNRQLQAYLRPSVLIVDLCGHGDYAEAAGPLGWELRLVAGHLAPRGLGIAAAR
jgi:IstB-like ATP binding protein